MRMSQPQSSWGAHTLASHSSLIAYENRSLGRKTGLARCVDVSRWVSRCCAPNVRDASFPCGTTNPRNRCYPRRATAGEKNSAGRCLSARRNVHDSLRERPTSRPQTSWRGERRSRRRVRPSVGLGRSSTLDNTIHPAGAGTTAGACRTGPARLPTGDQAGQGDWGAARRPRSLAMHCDAADRVDPH